MAVRESNHHFSPSIKNLFTVLVFIACIVVLVLFIYGLQVFLYKDVAGPKRGLHKITGISTESVYDLSGSEASGYGDPMKLFDEDADPANGIDPKPVTQPLPNPKMDIFYPSGKGLRIVIDLHDLYALSSFYLYDKSLASDSIWIYTGNMREWTLASAYKSVWEVAVWCW